MTSLQSHIKQIPANGGYYITIAKVDGTVYANTGTADAPVFNSNPFLSSVSTATTNSTIAIGSILRDEGQTLISASRVFRKVQLLLSTGALVSSGTDGVAGSAYGTANVTPYLTGYIELPGTGGYSSGSAGPLTAVARLG